MPLPRLLGLPGSSLGPGPHFFGMPKCIWYKHKMNPGHRNIYFFQIRTLQFNIGN